MKKLLSLVLVMLMLGSCVFAGAQTVPQDRTVLTLWHSMGSRNGDAVKAIVDAYNASQDVYFVDAQYQGSYDDTIAKIKSTPEGMRPDIMQLNDVATLWMYNTDYFVPVQNYIDAEGFDVSAYQENILAYYTINGKLSSMPFNCSVPALSYNVEALAAAGVSPEDLVTLDDVLDAAQKIVEAGVCQYGAVLDNDCWLFEQYISMLGADLMNNGNGRDGIPTKLAIDENGAGLKLLEIFRNFMSSEYTTNFGSGTSGGTAEGKKEFAAGNIPMFISTCGNFRDLLDGADGSFTVAQTSLPKINAEDPYSVTIGGASLWILNNGEATQGDGAWDFIKFCSSPEMMAQWTFSTGYLPVSKDVESLDMYKAYLNENPGFALIMDELRESTPDSIGALTGVSTKFRLTVENEILMLLDDENYTCEEALESICAQVNEEIELYNLSNNLI